MKKLSIVAVILTALVSCKKETKTVTQIDPKTGDTVQVEVPVEEKASETTLAIVDSAGIFKQSFILEKGKTYPFISSQKDVHQLSAPTGEKQTVNSQSTDEVTFTVNDVVNNVYDITINFVGKKTSQSGNGQSVTIDTRAAAPKEENLKNKWSIDKALTGNQLKMKMDKSGKILSITGFEPIYAKINTALGNITKDAKLKTELLNDTKKGFNEEILKNQFTNNILVLPAKGVKIGEKWSKSENASQDGKIKLTTTYTLKSIENGVAEISVVGGIPKQSDKVDQNGFTHTISSELSQNGTIKFDQKSGWINTQNITVKTTESQTISDGKEKRTMGSVTTSNIMVNPTT